MWEHIEDYIPIDKCIDKGLYRIRARNFPLAIYNATRKGFKGRRMKFGEAYLFTEIHWDASEHFGTVKPIEFLGIPEEMSREKLIEFLHQKAQELGDE